MAEFLGQHIEPEMSPLSEMGKPIPFAAREAGYEHAKAMGLSQARAYEVVNTVSEMLARDKPYEAMAQGMKHLDLTGTYRLFAVLLAEAAAYRRKEKGNEQTPWPTIPTGESSGTPQAGRTRRQSKRPAARSG